MKILENISLKSYNTFGIDVKADKLAVIRNNDDIRWLYDNDMFSMNKTLLLGGGSNILFTNDYHGLVLLSQIKGMKILSSSDTSVLLEVGAGEEWHNFVTINLRNKYYGLENLALIPGFAGSAAVQNIGAYGIEQQDYFHSLRGFNIECGEFQELTKDECEFSYRNSIFKTKLKDGFIITHVRYNLSKVDTPNMGYKDLAEAAEKFSIVKPDAKYVYDTVCRLRNKKLPDTRLLGNAGSFFKNPLIPEDNFIKLSNKFNQLNGYKQTDGRYKLSAAWLIEKAGWKGKRDGDAGVYDKHSLILVNYGNASGNDILELSEKIVNSVLEMFDIELKPEVLIL